MKIHPAINVFTGILAVILCIVLVLSSLCTVIAGSVASSLSADSITKIIRSIDYSELLRLEDGGKSVSYETEGNIISPVAEASASALDAVQVPDANDNTDGDHAPETDYYEIPEEIVDDAQKEYNISPEAMKAIMESKFMEDIISSLSNGIVAGLTGDDSYVALSESDIKGIFNENMDEIVQITTEYLGTEVDEAELRETLTQFVDETAGDISSAINEAADMTVVVDEGLVEVFTFILSGALTTSLALVSAGLLILISLIRFWYFSGVFFGGVATAVSAVLSGLLALGISQVPSLFSVELESSGAVLEPVLRALTYNTAIGAGILALIAAALITASILLKKLVLKKKAATTEVLEAPVPTEV